jgi:hypothetical protein
MSRRDRNLQSDLQDLIIRRDLQTKLVESGYTIDREGNRLQLEVGAVYDPFVATLVQQQFKWRTVVSKTCVMVHDTDWKRVNLQEFPRSITKTSCLVSLRREQDRFMKDLKRRLDAKRGLQAQLSACLNPANLPRPEPDQ